MRQMSTRLAELVYAHKKTLEVSNHAWTDKHKNAIKQIVKEYFPSGSGFDHGTELDLDNSTPEKLIFHTYFHHMNEHGVYTNWTNHIVLVTPSLLHPGFKLRVTGKNKNDIKDYIYDLFDLALSIAVNNLGEVINPVIEV